MSLEAFKIMVEQRVLDDLRERLARTRFPDEVEGADWDYGTNLSYLKELCAYWQNDFDWRKQEAELNECSHFRTEITDFNIHFIHEKGKGENRIPMLLTHGFPDSFYRFKKIIPLLTTEKDGLSFDVVAPSLPGYGFSDRPTERGFNAKHIADLFAKLMTDKLGYKKFAAHGGDLGRGVTEQLALNHADSLIGIHLTDIPFAHLLTVPPESLSDDERDCVEAGRKWQTQEGAYAMMQATKPQTAAYGLNDSPAGLAAWIVEKFRSWSDCGGDVEKRFTKDELLTNVTIYWATETINSSFRLYYEATHNPPKNAGKHTEVPAGVAIFPKDIIRAPREAAERFFNVER